MSAPEWENEVVTEYWLEHYCTNHCTLCGNWGFLDTTGTATPAGVQVGRVNFCFCPNGQALRGQGASLDALVKQKLKNPFHRQL